jgi:MscS family membrane protein
MDAFLAKISNLETFDIQILLTIAVVIFTFIARRITKKLIIRYVKLHDYSLSRKAYVTKVFNFIILSTALLFLSLIWEFSVKGLSIYFVSFFTLVGVAFFANWSILSNITASLVLFFNYPFKIGDEISIFEGDKSITGKVVDINLFNIKLLGENNEIIAYPNNLALQRPIIRKEIPQEKLIEEI